jgi:sec-independent protein translocase protein TatB
MSGFSSPEFLLIVVLALVVLGPKRLPEIANKIGGWIGQARRMTRVMKRQLEEELNIDDLNQIAAPQDLITSEPVNREARAAAEAEARIAADADKASEEVSAAADAESTQPDPPHPEHVPRDDDTFSPLHAEEETEKSA